VSSNPTQGMDGWCVCVLSWCLGRGLATGWSLAQGVQPSVKKIITELNKMPGPLKGWKSQKKKGLVRYFCRSVFL
jgi:hypothetical protein